KYQDIIFINVGNGDCLIRDNIKAWTENINTQEIYYIITAVQNATKNLCDVVVKLRNERMQREMNIPINDIQNAEKFHYNLPFSIFPKLLRLFEPLKHIENVAIRNITDMLINAINILNEISPQLTMSNELSLFNIEHKALELFLKFLIKSHLHEIVGSFLDPRSKPNVTLHEVPKEFILNKCQAYYSQITCSFGNNLDKSIQELASEELERYISLPRFPFSENFDLYKWWKDSKHIFPGLATLAKEYLPLVSDNKITLNNLKKFYSVYQDEDTTNKIAFLD
ncbi:7835_t:CDS:2, partial [Dentiscutata heterogama]